jgi:hypothetical protein
VAWIWFFLLLISLGANAAMALLLLAGASASSSATSSVSFALQSLVDWLKRRGTKASLIMLAVLVSAAGCEELEQSQVRPLPKPWAAEVPVCNLPPQVRKRNWPSTNPSTRGQGSCVFASLINQAYWHNEFELAAFIQSNPEWQGGEYATRLMEKLDSIGVKYKANVHGDPRFLDWCTANRRGAIFWWKPSHCCTFMGWAIDPNDGKEYGYILDNNYPDRFERCEREQLIRLWAGYGGFALTLTSSEPASAMPWKSYEVIK